MTVILRDLETETVLWDRKTSNRSSVKSVAFSYDSRQAIAGSGNQITVWDVEMESGEGVSQNLAFTVNGVAFDQKGNRIGYGAGFYDKLLSGLNKQIPLIAITYEEQVLASVPSEPHDIKVHRIVTDKKLLDCPLNAK